ncbi:MAG: S8 family serine peptidase [Chloroflexi bacterium]|nr:S8 family serine peptidase [Chloroflexota bacterium]
MKSGKWLGLIVIGVLLLGLVGTVRAEPAPMVKVLIETRHHPGPSEEDLVHRAGGKVKYTYHLVQAIAASVPESAIAGLRTHPNVLTVDLDTEVRAIDAELDDTWGTKRIGAGIVHDSGNRGAGARIAIIDSGVDYNHPDLKPNYKGGRDFVNNDSDPMDDNGHGTHVAGTIAARDDGIGVVGVAPEAQIYALKVLDATGGGSFSDVIAALQWAVDNNMHVTNNSYGSSGDPGPIVKAAFDNAAAAGVLHVAAAGNSGNVSGVGDNVGYPARWESVVAVAATRQDDSRASFSSTGPAVELAAPGYQINSTWLGGGYGAMSGTSMASPHVAGTAGLVIASGITDANGNGRINDEVRQRLDQTADDLGESGRDTKYGFGLVNAAKAAAPPGPVNNPPTVTITSPTSGSSFPSGATISFGGTSNDPEDGDLTASLVWTSSLDGQIGTGGSFSKVLSDGSHAITASVADSGGKTGSASINITVGTPPPAPTLSVTVATDKTSYVNGKTVKITVTVKNGTTPISGAAVHLEITTANGNKVAADGTTDANGIAKFEHRVNTKSNGVGAYTVVATASKNGFTNGSGSTTFKVTR